MSLLILGLAGRERGWGIGRLGEVVMLLKGLTEVHELGYGITEMVLLLVGV